MYLINVNLEPSSADKIY